jgi:hypothetical protein
VLKKFLLAFSVLFALSTCGCAASDAPDEAPVTARGPGVNITPITRNQTKSAVTIQLAKDGKALLPIIISEKASQSTQAVAAELAEYLKRISGATFEIKTGGGESGIVLGTLAEFPTPALDKALEIVNSYDGKEAYAIRTREKRVLLLGATELGASHAAYRFLEELGVRWLAPAPEWEVVPSTPDLKFAQDITDRPTFLSRNIFFGWGYIREGVNFRGKTAEQEYSDWQRRNLQAQSFTVDTGHAYERIAAAYKKEFDEHPEYWALVNGKRQGPQFELSNPAVRKLIVDYAINYFKQNPNADMVSVDPADGGGTSQSEESKALGEPGDLAFALASYVAKELEKAYPGQHKMVGLYAYSWHSDPPPFELHPNVYVQLTTSFNQGRLTWPELLQEWPKKATNLGFYDYYSVWRWDNDSWYGGAVARRGYLEDRFKQFMEVNKKSGAFATSLWAESGNNWGMNGRGYYLANKMMWNPDINVDAVLNDYYEKAFGAGTTAMREYYRMRDDAVPVSPGTTGVLFRAVQRAGEATKNDAAVQRRLDDIKNFLSYQYLHDLWSAEQDASKKSELQNDIWTLAYRTRYSYMNHWEAIRQDWIHEESLKPGDPRPWKVDKPMTREETEALFQEGLNYYPELKIPQQVKFSSEIVPVEFDNEAPPANAPEMELWYQEGSRYLIYSLHGEAIPIHIHAGKYYGFKQHSYEITDASGKVLASGKPALDETVRFDFQPPAPGLYYFSYHDHGDMGQVYWKPDQLVAMQTGERGYRAMRTIPTMYFYVPKGNKTVEYYFAREPSQGGSWFAIADPAGHVTRVDASGDFFSMPVPPGTDGKLWMIGGPNFQLGYFKFFNVPNYLSFSPNRVLLPRDVAEKDGLKIVR